ncbi:MAG: helix-turn-helix transcriptional regulator [Oscillospiraceae bacterium]|nr:helix-turn-helix transcriptional regulator [Oscillospiraceae bacterium]
MDIKKELTKGSSAMLVLSVLEKEDLYGYMIVKRISERSGNVFEFKEGTLYPILHNFEASGYVKSYWVECDGRNRKYYKITKKGLGALSDIKKEWETYTVAVGKVIHGNTATALA